MFRWQRNNQYSFSEINVVTLLLFLSMLLSNLIYDFRCGNQTIIGLCSGSEPVRLFTIVKLFCVDTLKDTLRHFIGDIKLRIVLTCKICYRGRSDILYFVFVYPHWESNYLVQHLLALRLEVSPGAFDFGKYWSSRSSFKIKFQFMEELNYFG